VHGGYDCHWSFDQPIVGGISPFIVVLHCHGGDVYPWSSSLLIVAAAEHFHVVNFQWLEYD
jgi:hypothetical protein